MFWLFFFFFKQKTAYEMRISDWSSDVCSSDLPNREIQRMKIWYQSMSRSAAWGLYHTVLTKLIETTKDPGTVVELHGITKIGGIADQYRYLEYLETGEVMENVQTAVENGFDAFVIGNIADPGLRECREIANIPVLGLCETSMRLSCQMVATFSLVTLNEKFTPRIVENAHRLGLERRIHSVERMKTDRILTLGDAFGSDTAKRDIIDQFMRTAGRAVDSGAEVVRSEEHPSELQSLMRNQYA